MNPRFGFLRPPCTAMSSNRWTKRSTPIYRGNPFINVDGDGRGQSDAFTDSTAADVGADIFRRGLCLPSDNKMTPEQQDIIIEIIHRCFLYKISRGGRFPDNPKMSRGDRILDSPEKR